MIVLNLEETFLYAPAVELLPPGDDVVPTSDVLVQQTLTVGYSAIYLRQRETEMS